MTQARCDKRVEITPKQLRHFGVVGSCKKGSILIIGEKPARPHLGLNAPFAEMRGCSGWLNTLLEAANIDEEELTWINALDNENRVAPITDVVRRVKPRAIICLGNRARQIYELLYGNSKGVETFYHPQAWKRFHSKKEYPLIARLIELGAQKKQS